MALPHLSINMAMTLDGKVVLPDGRWQGLSSSEDRRRMGLIRKNADALIVGVNSVENDDPDPGVKNGEGPVPVLIARNSLPSHFKKVFKNGRTILYTRKEVVQDKSEIYGPICQIRIRSAADLAPMKILEDLYDSGFKRVLLEGGPKLNYSFLREDFVSEINLTIVPFVIGQRNLPGIVDGDEAFIGFEKKKWSMVFSETVNDEVFLRYSKK